jgi:hypothetical protein
MPQKTNNIHSCRKQENIKSFKSQSPFLNFNYIEDIVIQGKTLLSDVNNHIETLIHSQTDDNSFFKNFRGFVDIQKEIQ